MLDAALSILTDIATDIALAAICVVALIVIGVLATLLWIALSGKHPTKSARHKIQ